MGVTLSRHTQFRGAAGCSREYSRPQRRRAGRTWAQVRPHLLLASASTAPTRCITTSTSRSCSDSVLVFGCVGAPLPRDSPSSALFRDPLVPKPRVDGGPRRRPDAVWAQESVPRQRTHPCSSPPLPRPEAAERGRGLRQPLHPRPRHVKTHRASRGRRSTARRWRCRRGRWAG